MYTTPPTRRHQHNRRISQQASRTPVTSPNLPGYSSHYRDPPPDYEADHSSLEIERPVSRSGPSSLSSRGSQSPRKRRNRLSASPQANPAGDDALLDSLLERSVHALEISNSLLQESMVVRPALKSAGSSPPETSEPENTSHSCATSQNVSQDTEEELDLDWLQTTRRVGGAHANLGSENTTRERWVDELDDISRTVDRLLNDTLDVGTSLGGGTTSSLPTSSPIQSLAHRRKKRRPSLDQIPPLSPHPIPMSSPTPTFPEEPLNAGHLRHAPQERSNLVAPPPRALTQYITHEEAATLALPSTLGIRASALKTIPSSPHIASFPNSPTVSDTLRIDGLPPSSSSSSSAYTILSSLVNAPPKPSGSGPTPPRSPLMPPSFPSPPGTHRSSSSISSIVSSPFSLAGLKNRRWSSTSQTTIASGRSRSSTASGQVPKVHSRRTSTECNSPREHSRSPRGTSKTGSVSGSPRRRDPPSPELRLCHQPEQTIPEESSLSSSSSSSDLHVEQTITSLRAILTAHPPPLPKESEVDQLIRTRRPKFSPRTGLVKADVGSSTATAEVRKLFSRSVIGGKHSSSTRGGSPPRRSSLKGGRQSRLGTNSTNSGAQTPILDMPPTPTASASSAATTVPDPTSSASAVLASAFPAHPPHTTSSTPFSSRVSTLSYSTRQFFVGKRPTLFGLGLPSPTSSPSASGSSTPASQKRISFAELPEGSTGSGGNRAMRRRSESTLRPRRSSSSSSRKGKKRRNGKRRAPDHHSSSSSEDDTAAGGSWLSWFIPPASVVNPPTGSSERPGHHTRSMMGSFRVPPGAGQGHFAEGADFWGGI